MTSDATSTKSGFVVAIDGPAGAGKSTVASHLATRFGLMNLETGAMYRAFALKVLSAGIDQGDSAAVLQLTHSTTIILQPRIGGNSVFLDGRDVTGQLRTSEVTAAASRISAYGPVREWMVAAQRSLGQASETGVVMEGRDIGTVVFPHANVKIFLDASLEARGDRRFTQGGNTGESREAIVTDMRDRDGRDRTREQSPLTAASDAVCIDTTALSLQQVLLETERLVSARMPHA